MAMLWLLPSFAVVLVALYVHHRHDSVKQQQQQPAASKKKKQKTKEQHSVYVIGDLHGDVTCARYWVERTGLVEHLDDTNSAWTDETSSLVFMGDYVDKGPTSKQTIEFVKQLTEQYPLYVTALMGNHEMELLRDRDEQNRNVWGGGGYFQLPYAAVHPGEYLNFVQNDEQHDKDELVVEALLNASLEVYGYGQYRKILFRPEQDGRSIVSLVNPPSLRPLVQERMTLYQKNYLDAFRSGTELGTWLEQRPVAVIKNGTLFVHGGVSPEALPHLVGSSSGSGSGVDRLNQLLAQHASEDELYTFLEETDEGRIIYEMLVYRGNHDGDDACEELLQDILPSLRQRRQADNNDDNDGIVSRIAVGHTPGDSVRMLCNGTLLALDSSLSRWFRSSGNEYCRGDKQQVSSNKRFRCPQMNHKCQGQIVKIQANGVVEIIE